MEERSTNNVGTIQSSNHPTSFTDTQTIRSHTASSSDEVYEIPWGLFGDYPLLEQHSSRGPDPLLRACVVSLLFSFYSNVMLTVSAATQLGPLMLETVIKHYLKRKSVTKYSKAREELLFDEAFVVVKTFLEISTRHTVDELQKFSLTRTLSPPWVLLHRVLIPISPTCSRAAEILIEALGGPEQALKICGGTKWWTVRMQAGVEAEWIGIKSDWQREERRRKQATAEKKKRRASLSRQERAKETVKDKFKRKEDGENDDQANEADYEHGDCE